MVTSIDENQYDGYITSGITNLIKDETCETSCLWTMSKFLNFLHS